MYLILSVQHAKAVTHQAPAQKQKAPPSARRDGRYLSTHSHLTTQCLITSAARCRIRYSVDPVCAALIRAQIPQIPRIVSIAH